MGVKSKKISATSRRTKFFLCSVAGAFGLFFNVATSFAADFALSYSGRLAQTDGAPVAGPVDVTVKFWTDISSGNTLGSQIDYTAVPLNQGVFSLPLELSSAQVAAIFRDGSEPVFIEVTAAGKTYPRQQYNYVPYALRVPVDGTSVVFDQNGNLGLRGTQQAAAGSYLTSDGSGGVSWKSPSFGSLTPQSVSASKPSSGEVLTYDGGQWVPKSVSITGAGGGTVTSITAGAGLTGGTVTNSGTIGLANVGTAGTYAKVVTDAQGRVTSGTSLAAADLPPLSAALITSGTLAAANGGTGVSSSATFPLSGVVVTETAIETLTNKILSGATINGASNISGATTINTTSTIASGAQTVSGNVTILGNTATANKLVLNDKGSTNSVSLKAPDTLGSSLIWELPSTNGTSGQVLSTNGSGTLSWTSGASPTGAAGGDLTGSFPSPSLAAAGTAGIYTKVTTDGKGRVISGGSLTSGDLPPISASSLITGTLAVSNGGTGVSAFTDKGVVIGSSSALSSTAAGTQYNVFVAGPGGQPEFGQVNLGSASAVSGVLPTTNGGLGLSTTPTSGQILVGNGTGYSLGSVSQGTTQGVSVVSSASGIVLDTAQDIRPSATPNFSGLTLSGAAANSLLKTNSSKLLTAASSSDVIATLGFTPLSKAGDTMTGALDMNSQAITNAGNVTINAAKTLGLGIFDNTSETTLIGSLTNLDKGKTWFNSSTSEIKYWTGSAARALGVSGAGLTSLNGLTGSAQSFAAGTSGNNLEFSSSGSLHTLNIPLASATGVTAGLISNSDFASFGAKLGGVAAGTGVSVSTASGTATVSLSSVGTAGTYVKVQTNAQGQVVGSSALLAADIPNLDASKITTGQLSVANGGTGISTFNPNGVLIGNGTGNLLSTASPSADQILRVPSAGGQPSFGAIDLSKSVSVGGILAGANGGTGVNSTATFPTSGVVVTEAATETLTNKTLNGATINGASNISGATTINTTSTIASGAQTVTGNVSILGSGTAANKLVLSNKDSTTSVSLKAPDTLGSSLIWELPSTNGSAGQVLSTNGSGTLTWTSGASPTGAASGDLTGNFPGPTVATVGASSAANIHAAELAANAATELNTPSKIVKRDISGNFSAGTITANLTGNVTGNLTGNASTATSATSFTGPLVGDVTGTQGATVVASVGGATASSVATGANLANAATNANTASTIVKRDGSGNFTAGTITANLTGTASNATSAASFTGPLSGDVTGTQGTTVVSTVGASSAANIHAAELAANAASSSNNSLALVKRDSNGGFSSGQISAATPNATSQGLVVKGAASQTANLQEWQDSTGVVLSAMSSAGYLKLKDSDGTDNYVSLRASPNMAANLTYTLPGTVSAGAYLTTDGSGTLSWSSPGSFSGSLAGDVTGTQGATVVATISGVSAATVAAGANLANAATNANTASKLVARDASGNFSAGTITANLTGTASNAASAVSFTSSLAGDVTGTQGATSVANVGGVTAANVANGATLANSAVSANTASTLVKRDASGNFSAGTITANLAGTVTGSLIGNASTATSATSATSFTGSLAGDVSGSQGTTTVTKLQGQAVASTAPSSGQVLTWSGSTWSPQTPAGASSVSIATKSADYTVTTADAGKYFLVSGAMTTLTLPAAASVSSGFSITVKGVGGWAIVTPSGTDQIDGSTQSVALTNQAILQIVTDGAAWYQGYSFGSTYRGTPVACGANCYSNSSAISAGLAYTATGKTLLLTNSIWVQANGTNVLRVDGSDNWHYALSPDGKSYSANLLNKNTATIGGRTCPASVYIDDTNKIASGRCVYYDQGNLAQRLDAPNGDGVTDQATAGSIRIGARAGNAGFWYSGNIQTCANKGMRLPTLYETTAAQPAATYLPVDATNNPTPSWSTMLTGVPMAAGAAYSWTASAYTGGSNLYCLWVGTTTTCVNYANGYAVRCIVP